MTSTDQSYYICSGKDGCIGSGVNHSPGRCPNCAKDLVRVNGRGEPIADQPAPMPNAGPAIWDLVIADVEAYPTMHVREPTRSLLLADMRERDRLGRERYGTPLQAGNGRAALVDAYQEQLDCCAYIRQSIAEGDLEEWAGLYDSAITLAYQIRNRIRRRDEMRRKQAT